MNNGDFESIFLGSRLFQNIHSVKEVKTGIDNTAQTSLISSDLTSPFFTAIPAMACHDPTILSLQRLVIVERE